MCVNTVYNIFYNIRYFLKIFGFSELSLLKRSEKSYEFLLELKEFKKNVVNMQYIVFII